MVSLSTLFSPVTRAAFYTKEGFRYFAGDLKRGATRVKNYIVNNRGIDAPKTAEEKKRDTGSS